VPHPASKHRKLLGEAIRAERLARHWTQEQFAEKSDLSLNFVGNVERGEQAVSLDSLVRMASALRLTLKELMAKAGI
jgi:transcriptional regulator with XRE-family HTH domain